MTPTIKSEINAPGNAASTETSTSGPARKGTTSLTVRAPKKTVAKTGVRPRVRFEDRIFAGVHHTSGRLATIRQVIASDVPTRMGRELSLDERVRLTTRRIRENNRFVPMMMLGVRGVIDKKRALKEIKALSPIGLHLLEFDMRHSRLQMEQSLAGRSKRRRKSSDGNNGSN
jgi:hypothetical protein